MPKKYSGVIQLIPKNCFALNQAVTVFASRISLPLQIKLSKLSGSISKTSISSSKSPSTWLFNLLKSRARNKWITSSEYPGALTRAPSSSHFSALYPDSSWISLLIEFIGVSPISKVPAGNSSKYLDTANLYWRRSITLFSVSYTHLTLPTKRIV